MKKYISVSDNIRMLREAVGYSQEYVAIQLGISQQAYSNIEKKPGNCSLDKLKRIASILQIPFVTLVNEDGGLVFQSFYQSGGKVATNMNVQPSENETSAYERLVNELKQQNDYLKKIIDSKL